MRTQGAACPLAGAKSDHRQFVPVCKRPRLCWMHWSDFFDRRLCPLPQPSPGIDDQLEGARSTDIAAGSRGHRPAPRPQHPALPLARPDRATAPRSIRHAPQQVSSHASPGKTRSDSLGRRGLHCFTRRASRLYVTGTDGCAST